MSAVLDCIHGIDLMWPCLSCQELSGQVAKEYEMQMRGTFPELTIKPSKGKVTTMPCKGSSKSSKSGGRKK